MRVNNKGFAISTALYGLLMVFIIVLMLILQIMRTTNNNNKDIASNIQKKLDYCKTYRQNYNKCTSDCDKWFNLNKLCFEYTDKFKEIVKEENNLVDQYENDPTTNNLNNLENELMKK